MLSVGQKVILQDESKSNREIDWAIVQNVQAGNVASFDRLVERYRERIYSIIYNLTSNAEDASDLSQETFIKAFSSIHKFRGKSSFYTWIYKIAVNTTLTFLKKRNKRRFISYEQIDEEVSSSEIFEKLTAKTRSEKGVLLHELQETLNESLQKLSAKHRAVIVLHDIEGLDHAEVSKIVGCSVGTVRSRLHYAKQQLRASLSNYVNS